MDQITDRQSALLAYLREMNSAEPESWACFVNLGYALADGQRLHDLGLADIGEQMGMPVIRMKRPAHVSVPVEPTDDMIKAGADKWEECYFGNRDGSLDLSTEQTAEEIYKAMISAAIQSSAKA